MLRREFIRRIAVTGASGVGAIEIAAAAEVKTVLTYKIEGFSCPTCAVGLEVMLRQQKGIARAQASYPDSTVTIGYDPDSIVESSIREFIENMGFTVVEQRI